MKPVRKRALVSVAAVIAFATLVHFLPDGTYQQPLFLGVFAAFCFAFHRFLRRS